MEGDDWLVRGCCLGDEHIVIDVLVTQLYICHTYQIVHLKLVDFTVCNLDIYKTILFNAIRMHST